MADALEDAASVLGPSAMLSLLAAPLAEAAAAGWGGRPVDWAAAEGALFCVKATARVATPRHGDPLLLSLLASLPSLPVGDATLTSTAAGVAGACAEWVASSADGGDAAAAAAERGLLDWLARCLGAGPPVAGAAASALASLAAAASGRAGEYATPLATLFAQAATTPPDASPPPLPEPDLHALGDAAMAAACAVRDPSSRRAAVDAVLAPVEATLAAAAASPAGAGGPAALAHADRAAALLRRTRDAGAAAAALGRLWPALEGGLAACAGDATAVERWCRVARHGLKSAGRDAAPLLPALADKLPRWFAGTQASAFLYVASELVKTFGSVPDAAPAVSSLLSSCLAAAAAALPDAAAVDAAPDVADDAFLLGGRALAYAPALALAPPAADGVAALVATATHGALVQHREACTSLLHFLERLCSPDTLAAAGPSGAAAAAAAVHPRGARLVAHLLAGALGALPPPRVRDIADALYALLRAARGAGVEWVAAALASLPDAAAPAAERARVLDAATAVASGTGAADAGALDDALDDLSETVRRSAAARRAALTALVPDAPARVLA